MKMNAESAREIDKSMINSKRYLSEGRGMSSLKLNSNSSVNLKSTTAFLRNLNNEENPVIANPISKSCVSRLLFHDIRKDSLRDEKEITVGEG
jgi:hypothetical protein